MTTTITLEYNDSSLPWLVGVPNVQDSIFEWEIDGVVSSGTFVDGTPWVVVGPSATLVSVSPERGLTTTTHTSNRYSEIVDVYINGSAKNPIPSNYYDENNLTPRSPTGNGKFFLDGRPVYGSAADADRVEGDYDIDQALDLSSPVPISAGDVIVTAASEWFVPTTPAEQSVEIPNTLGGRRTAIKRIGVLTVLTEAPSEPCFRPPFQWFGSSPRPDPIPLSSVIDDQSALEHNSNIAYESDYYFSSPIYHDGDPIAYQSSQGHYAISTKPNSVNSNISYFGTAGSFLSILLRDATNTNNTDVQRQTARNRLIQYGIDCFGSVMSLIRTDSGAGQRPAELKPWVLLAGWWLNNEQMKSMYQSVRNNHAGTAISQLSDKQIGYLLFNDDYVCRQVTDSPLFGSVIKQTWTPNSSFTVTSAEEVSNVNIFDAVPLSGTFAKLNVSGFNIRVFDHQAKRINYYGSYVKITGGAGAGSTHYKVLTVGSLSTNTAYPDQFLILDRPWVNGIPDATSTIELFAARNGTVDSDTSDIGRYHFSREGQTSDTNHGWDDLSFSNDIYANIASKVMVFPYAALKRLRDVTDDVRYVSGETWGWLGEILLGSGTSVSDRTTRFGSCPDSDRIQNLGWDGFGTSTRYNLNEARLNIFLGWLGEEYRSDYSRIPGVAGDSDGGETTPPVTVDFEWQRSTNGGTSWTTIDSGTTTATDGIQSLTLSLPSITDITLNGSQYRLVLTPENGPPVISQTATLTVNNGIITISDDIDNVTVRAWRNAAFISGVFTNNGQTVSRAWQISGPSTSGWISAPGSEPEDSSYFRAGESTDLSYDGLQVRFLASAPFCEGATSNVATMTVTPISLVAASQPSSLTVDTGGNGSFTFSIGLAATPQVPTDPKPVFQWQENRGEGFSNTGPATVVNGVTNTLQLTNIPFGSHLNEYRCLVSLSGASPLTLTSNVATLSVNAPPVIVFDQYGDVSTIAPIPATLEVLNASTNTGFPIQYQWQISGGSWSDIVDANDSSYTTPATTVASDNGTQFRCILRSGSLVATADAATLSVVPGTITISKSPSNIELLEGTTGDIRVNGTIDNTETIQYQWQVSGGSWSAVENGLTYAGADTETLVLNSVVLGMSGNEYRCLLSATNADGATTNSARLAVIAAATTGTIFFANSGDFSTVAPLPYSFEVTTIDASGSSVNYAWFKSTDGGSSYSLVTGGVIEDDSTGISESTVTGDNGTLFVCSLTADGFFSATAGPNLLTVNAGTIKVQNQPPSELSIQATAGFSLSTNATTNNGQSISFQWTENGTNLTNGGVVSGARSNTLTFSESTEDMDGNVYLCRLTAPHAATITSSSTTLTVIPAEEGNQGIIQFTVVPNITEIDLYPQYSLSQTILSPDGNGVGAIATNDEIVTYQWQIQASGSATFEDITGSNSFNFSRIASLAAAGSSYRCRMRATNCPDVTTDPVLLNVIPPTLEINTAVTPNQPISRTRKAFDFAFNTLVYDPRVALVVNGAPPSGSIVTRFFEGSTDGGTSWHPLTQVAYATGNFPLTPSGVQIADTIDSNPRTMRFDGETAAAATVFGVGGTGFSGFRIRARASGDYYTNELITNEAVITVIPATIPNTVAQISNQIPFEGDDVILSISPMVVTADNFRFVSYQWQASGGSWTDITGATGATFAVLGITPSSEGFVYRCVLSTPGAFDNPSTQTNPVHVVPAEGINITVQPQDISVTAPDPATFMVDVNENGGMSEDIDGFEATYQWQLNPLGEGSFSNISGEIQKTLTIDPTDIGMDGNQFRCVIGAEGFSSVTSNIATLRVFGVGDPGNPENPKNPISSPGTSFCDIATIPPIRRINTVPTTRCP